MKLKVGKQFRSFTIERSAIDKDKRTVNLSFSSETPVERWWGIEILDHERKSVNLRRLKKGGSLLIDHDMKSLVGVIEEVSIDEADRKGRAVVRFGRRQTAEDVFQDVLDGIRSNVSVGYQVNEAVLEKEIKDGPSTYRITDWEPYEISLVSVPADITVGIGRSEDEINPKEIEVKIPVKKEEKREESQEQETRIELPNKEERKMNKCEKCAANLVDGKCPACELERQQKEKEGQRSALEMEKGRISAIEKLCKLNDLDDRYKEMWIGQGTAIEKIADELLLIKAERGKSNPLSKIGLTSAETKRYSIVRAIRAIDQKDWTKAPFELECTRTVSENLKMAPDPNKFYVPYEVLERPIDPNFAVDRFGRRDISIGVGGGAFLVGVENMGFIELLRNRTVCLKMGATRLTGLVGNVTIPKQTGAATAYWVGESVAITESQQTFVQVALSPKTCGGYTEISRQLLLQSSPGVESIVNNDLTNVVAIAVDLGVLSGTGGAAKPLGITGYSGLGSVSGTAFTYAAIMEFQTDVAGSNVVPLRPGYVTPSATAGTAKQKVKFASTASPIWEGSLWDGTIDGMPAMSSEQMSSATMLFGDWSQVIIAEWGVLEVEVNPYADFKAGILGVRCIYSMDSALRNAGAFSYASSISWS